MPPLLDRTQKLLGLKARKNKAQGFSPGYRPQKIPSALKGREKITQQGSVAYPTGLPPRTNRVVSSSPPALKFLPNPGRRSSHVENRINEHHIVPNQFVVYRKREIRSQLAMKAEKLAVNSSSAGQRSHIAENRFEKIVTQADFLFVIEKASFVQIPRHPIVKFNVHDKERLSRFSLSCRTLSRSSFSEINSASPDSIEAFRAAKTSPCHSGDSTSSSASKLSQSTSIHSRRSGWDSVTSCSLIDMPEPTPRHSKLQGEPHSLIKTPSAKISTHQGFFLPTKHFLLITSHFHHG